METTNPLSKYCQTKRERALVEGYIKTATDQSHYWYIMLIVAIVSAIMTVLAGYYRGIDTRTFWNSFNTTIIGALLSVWFRERTAMGKMLKRISESK